ncbi:MAG: ribulokinase [Planctomycetota bacterium]|jgi:L-ribulokinase
MSYVIGVDFGSDSVRAIVVNAQTGEELGDQVHNYARWAEGKYCVPAESQFRQHPLDYMEGLESAIKGALAKSPEGVAAEVKGIGVDTTGSTPVAVNKEGVPLALLDEFAENPNAMFFLWKDHTALKEAAEINELARTWGGEDFTKFEGGIYSSEWFWAKVLHALRADEEVREAAFSWVEHCDWIPAMLTGNTDPLTMKRSRCASGHKAMWHESWDGLPPEEFLTKLDPVLAGLRDRLYHDTQTSDTKVGGLTAEWAQKLGLPEGTAVAVGAFDCHMGAVGAGAEAHTMVKVIGTSTCDVIVSPHEEVGDKLIAGICGQVDGSVVPGMTGLEAGQSAFGDIYAWFKRLILWPVTELLAESETVDAETREKLIAEVSKKTLPMVEKAAAEIGIGETGILALDWMNGRRTPNADQALKGAIMGLNLGSDAPRIFRALAEATAFGSKAIMECMEKQGVAIKEVIAIGGIAKKSNFVMQILADVLNREIKVASSEQACALGAAMFGAVAAGIYPTTEEAIKAMNSGFDADYAPIPENVAAYQKLYEEYGRFCKFVETETHRG